MKAELRKILVDAIREYVGCGMEEAQRILDSPPTYVRQLRDQAAVAALGGYVSNLDGARATDAIDRGEDVGAIAAGAAIGYAYALVHALGYVAPDAAEETT